MYTCISLTCLSQTIPLTSATVSSMKTGVPVPVLIQPVSLLTLGPSPEAFVIVLGKQMLLDSQISSRQCH